MTLYLAHQSSEILRCAFYTVVVKNESIRKLYPRGLNGFIQKHRCRCNTDISVQWSMGGEIDKVISDLREKGFKVPRDFFFFDAASMAIDEMLPLTKRLLPNPERTLPYVISEPGGWLKIGIDADGIYICSKEEP